MKKIRKLFSFYLHEAPTIESKSSIYLDLNKLDQRWGSFVQAVPNIKKKLFHILIRQIRFKNV